MKTFRLFLVSLACLVAFYLAMEGARYVRNFSELLTLTFFAIALVTLVYAIVYLWRFSKAFLGFRS